MNENEIIDFIRKLVNSKFGKFIIEKLVTPQKIQKMLAIYAKVEEPNGIKENLEYKIIEKFMNNAANKFGIKEETIRNYLKDSYMRKGFANIIYGIAKYGVTKPQRLPAPFMVVWNFTKQCNLRCKHCYANAGPLPAPDELSLEERFKVIDELDEAGVAAISFSGGEPLINKDFWKVAEYAHKKGFYISIATNGTLISKKVAVRLKEVGVRYVEISIDGPREFHDKFRGLNGAFDMSIKGAKNVKEVGLQLGIATVATKGNLKLIPDIIKIAREVNADRFIVFNFVPTGRGKKIIEQDLSPEEREELLKYLFEEWKKGDMQIFSTSPTYSRITLSKDKFSPTHFAEIELPEGTSALAEFIGGCGAGRIYCSIEHNGDIQPCVFIPIKVGNVIKDGFKKVWEESEILNKLRNRDSNEYGCKNCHYRYICGGCRARAYGYFGDILAPDPGCIIMKEEWEKLKKEINK